jgi:hypothetical protein
MPSPRASPKGALTAVPLFGCPAREDIKRCLGGRTFAFSLIVHSESDGPLINFHTSSPILNVRTDCPPQVRAGTAGAGALHAAQDVQLRLAADWGWQLNGARS